MLHAVGTAVMLAVMARVGEIPGCLLQRACTRTPSEPWSTRIDEYRVCSGREPGEAPVRVSACCEIVLTSTQLLLRLIAPCRQPYGSAHYVWRRGWIEPDGGRCTGSYSGRRHWSRRRRTELLHKFAAHCEASRWVTPAPVCLSTIKGAPPEACCALPSQANACPSPSSNGVTGQAGPGTLVSALIAISSIRKED